jgi:transcription initiation factor TFIIIB Brf1 subunit/transcription initiation factor TFIIB
MVKVIKDNSKKMCVCSHCDSVLEYDIKDITYSSNWLGDTYSYIRCPACDTLTICKIKCND